MPRWPLSCRGPTPSFSMASVAGTEHFSFSDAPFVMPATITRFGGRIIPRRGWSVITRTLRAYLDQSGERRQTFPLGHANCPS